MTVAATMWWYSKNGLVAAITHAVRKFVQRRGYDPTIVVVPASERDGDAISKVLQAAGIDIQVGYRDKDHPPQYFYLYPVVTKRNPKLVVERIAL